MKIKTMTWCALVCRMCWLWAEIQFCCSTLIALANMNGTDTNGTECVYAIVIISMKIRKMFLIFRTMSMDSVFGVDFLCYIENEKVPLRIITLHIFEQKQENYIIKSRLQRTYVLTSFGNRNENFMTTKTYCVRKWTVPWKSQWFIFHYWQQETIAIGILAYFHVKLKVQVDSHSLGTVTIVVVIHGRIERSDFTS